MVRAIILEPITTPNIRFDSLCSADVIPIKVSGKEVEKPEWHNVNSEHVKLSGEHYLINIPMDNGNEVQFWAPWCGYFESLYGAEIVPDKEVDDAKNVHFECNRTRAVRKATDLR